MSKHVQIAPGVYVKAYPYTSIGGEEDGYRARFSLLVQTDTHGSLIEAQNAMLDEARKKLETAMDAIDQMRNKTHLRKVK